MSKTFLVLLAGVFRWTAYRIWVSFWLVQNWQAKNPILIKITICRNMEIYHETESFQYQQSFFILKKCVFQNLQQSMHSNDCIRRSFWESINMKRMGTMQIPYLIVNQVEFSPGNKVGGITLMWNHWTCLKLLVSQKEICSLAMFCWKICK